MEKEVSRHDESMAPTVMASGADAGEPLAARAFSLPEATTLRTPEL